MSDDPGTDASKRIAGGFSVGVLVGGASTRMGRDKALLDCGGRTLLEVVCERVGRGAKEVILAIGRAGRLLPPSLQAHRQVVDAIEGVGPIAGVLALVETAKTDWLVVVPCDMPRLAAEHLSHLVEAAQGAGAAAAIYRRHGRDESLPLAIRISAAPALRAAIARGDYRLTAVLDLVPALRLDAESVPGSRDLEGPFHNLNHPAEFDAFRRGDPA